MIQDPEGLRLWALDQVERLALAAYRQFEVSQMEPGSSSYAYLADDVEAVMNELAAADIYHTGAVLQAFAGLTGAYAQLIAQATGNPGEELLTSLINSARAGGRQS